MKELHLIIALLAIGVFSINAQNDDVPARIATDMVSLNVSVKDAHGKPVPGLMQGQFEIFDNEVRQRIEHFSHASAGVTFGIVYDMHPTTNEQTASVLAGLRKFTLALPQPDDFFMVVFNERGSLSVNVIPDAAQLERHLASPDKREPRSLYDALRLAAAKLRSAKNLKRALLVVTDAADHNSRCSFNELRGELRKLDVQVYAITPDPKIGDFYSYEDLTTPREPTAQTLSDASPSERAALNSITLRTGGATFTPSLQRPDSVENVLKQASAEMHSGYSISFYPSQPPDGTWHNLRIRLRKSPGSKEYVLTYRLGYQSGPAGKGF